MEVNISEEEQRNYFLTKWKEKDTRFICEVPVFSRSIDLVKYDQKNNTISAIEFKTRNWKRAVEQVMSTSISFDYVEICVRKPKTIKTQEAIKEYCRGMGVGIYFFDTDELEFEHILQPERVKKMWNVQKIQVIDFILNEG